MDYRCYLESQLQGIVKISDEQFCRLQKFIEELLRWNKKVNLTAITDPGACWEKHVLDSLLLGSMLNGDEHLLDIGSGAGLPSIPLKIVFPQLQILSVDSVIKKVSFQRHICRSLGLVGFNAEGARVENLSEEYGGQFNIVTSRAFASLELFLKYSIPFMSRGGRLLAMKSSAIDSEIGMANEIMTDNGLYISNRKSFVLPLSGAKREILEISSKQIKI